MLKSLGTLNAETEISREYLLASFLNIFERSMDILEVEGFTPFLDEYYKYWMHS
jgi:biotin-(acetyl-CoA carboxylase) ligase